MMEIGGERADGLAERFGTPLVVIDLRALDGALDAMLAAAAPHGIAISYAGKALLLPGLVRHLHPRPIGIDVCSIGELAVAERGGFEAARLTLHGAGKIDAELDAALDGRVGRIVVDGMDELRRLVARTRGRGADLLLRFNTGIEAHTHDFVRTAGDRSKFGFAPTEEDAALELLRANPALRLRGVHAHIGSQVYDAMPYVENAQRLLAVLERARSAGFARADTMVIGGGFGVQMHPGATDEVVDIAGVLDAVARVIPSGVRVEIEPGRALIGTAGTSLYRVMAVKRFGQRRFAIIDGSMADNPRPAIYGAYHHVEALRIDSPLAQTMVCGRSCEADELGEAMLPEDLRAGDLVAMLATGAYTYSMSSNYNYFPRPPVIAVGEGEPQVWASRETL
ncbi:MAG TPA: diaminopimelate decarboxylase [Candidatus Baltobacteraceae bacterium]|nr:diaminopimelate decarboxylase [Candidatus Baltobacteraceae bacterium]